MMVSIDTSASQITEAMYIDSILSHGLEGKVWMDLTSQPRWGDDYEYRRKPRTVNINGFEVPEPVRSPLERGTKYFSPAIDHDSKLCITSKWGNFSPDYIALNRGLIHLSEEAAIKHAEALLSFTRIEK